MSCRTQWRWQPSAVGEGQLEEADAAAGEGAAVVLGDIGVVEQHHCRHAQVRERLGEEDRAQAAHLPK